MSDTEVLLQEAEEEIRDEKLEKIMVVAEKAHDQVIKDYGVKEDIKSVNMEAAYNHANIDEEFVMLQKNERKLYSVYYSWFEDFVTGELGYSVKN